MLTKRLPLFRNWLQNAPRRIEGRAVFTAVDGDLDEAAGVLHELDDAIVSLGFQRCAGSVDGFLLFGDGSKGGWP